MSKRSKPPVDPTTDQKADQTDETTLFSELMSDVTPILTDSVRLKDKNQLEASTIQHNRRAATEHRVTEFDPVSSMAESVDADQALNFHRSGVQPKVMQRLKNGEIPYDDRIDLHGYRAHFATAELEGFFQNAVSEQFRCLLIIHGKGERKAGNLPVIKNLLNQWLPEQPEVLAFHSAPARLGGAGALLVLLKRDR